MEKEKSTNQFVDFHQIKNPNHDKVWELLMQHSAHPNHEIRRDTHDAQTNRILTTGTVIPAKLISGNYPESLGPFVKSFSGSYEVYHKLSVRKNIK